MPASYDAICDGNRLKWLGDHPSQGPHRVRVIVLEPDAALPEQTVDEVLEGAFGAWTPAMTPEEVDAKLRALRTEWSRPWYGEAEDV